MCLRKERLRNILPGQIGREAIQSEGITFNAMAHRSVYNKGMQRNYILIAAECRIL